MSDDMDEQVSPARLRSLPSRLLSHIAMQADRLVNAGLAREDARKWHYAALVALRESGPVSQAELSRRTGVYRSDLVAVINELADRGLVERTPDPDDRRRNVVSMTSRGGEHLNRLDALVDEIQDDLLAPLDKRERDQLIGLLAKLRDHHAQPAHTKGE